MYINPCIVHDHLDDLDAASGKEGREEFGKETVTNDHGQWSLWSLLVSVTGRVVSSNVPFSPLVS